MPSIRDVAVIVVNYGSDRLIDENFGPLGELAEIIVVDNHRSDPETAAMVRLADARGWRCITLPANVGFGAGVNVGVAAAIELGLSVLFIVNPDLRMSPEAMRALAERSRREPAALISPRVIRPDGVGWFTGGSVLLDRGRTSSSPAANGTDGAWLSGACLVAGAEWWRKVGGFDDSYFLYWEDVDLSWRWVRAGGTLHLANDATVVHAVGGTQGADGKSPRYVYYNCRNRLLFARKNLSRRAAWRWVGTTWGYGLEVMQRGGRRQLIKHFWSLGAAAICGSVAGIGAVVRGPEQKEVTSA